MYTLTQLLTNHLDSVTQRLGYEEARNYTGNRIDEWFDKVSELRSEKFAIVDWLKRLKEIEMMERFDSCFAEAVARNTDEMEVPSLFDELCQMTVAHDKVMNVNNKCVA